MKESILGRFSPSVLRVVALSCVMFFISLGTSFAQNVFVSNQSAQAILKSEIENFRSQVSTGNAAEIGPELILGVSNQSYANWFMAEMLYYHISDQDNNVDLPALIGAVTERSKVLGKAPDVFFDNGQVYLTSILTN